MGMTERATQVREYTGGPLLPMLRSAQQLLADGEVERARGTLAQLELGLRFVLSELGRLREAVEVQMK